MNQTKDKNVTQLCNNIELYLGRKMRTPKDFNYLTETILMRTRLYVSSTTLKRMWGYLKETTRARISTLDVLSKFLGYDDWVHFCQTNTLFNPNFQEGNVESHKISSSQLHVGQHIQIDWMPNSNCTLEYIGDRTFKVISAINSRLSSENIVHCSFFIEGKPLYFFDSTIDGLKYDIYYVGKTGGINFHLID